MDKTKTVTIIEAAEILGISVGTIRRRVKDGTIKAMPVPSQLKQPKRLEFDRAYIEKLAKS